MTAAVRTSMMISRIALKVFIAVILAAAAPAAALAHAVLLGSEPADGAVLQHAPAEVMLRFSEPVLPIRVQVLGPDGMAVAGTDESRAEDHSLLISLPEELSAGTHLVSYRVRSLDGHPVGGSLSFSLGAATAEPDAVARLGIEAMWRVSEGLARLVQILSIFIAGGGALYLIAVERGQPPLPALRVIMAAAVAAGLAATVLRGGLYGGLLHAAPAADFLSQQVWREGFAASRGLSALLAGAGLAAIALGLGFSNAALRCAFFGIGGAATILSFPLTGHVATAEPYWLAVGLLAVHVAVAAFWAGSLIPLWLRTQSSAPGQIAPVIARFSQAAIGAVVLLLFAGVGLAWLILDTFSEVSASSYGRLLLGKAGLLALLVALAAVNKQVLTPRLLVGDDDARRRLARNIVGEGWLVMLIVAVAVALAQTSPPRHAHHVHHGHGPHAHHEHDHASAEVPAQRRIVVAEADERQVVVSVQPARAGENDIMLQLSDQKGNLLKPLEVTIEFASEDLGVEPIRRDMEAIGGRRFGLRSNDFSLPGTWQVRIDALITDFEKDIFRVEIEIE